MKTLMSVNKLQSQYLQSISSLDCFPDHISGKHEVDVRPVWCDDPIMGLLHHKFSVKSRFQHSAVPTFVRALRLRDLNHQLLRRSTVVIQYDWLDNADSLFLQTVTYRRYLKSRGLLNIDSLLIKGRTYDLSDVWYVDSVSDMEEQSPMNLSTESGNWISI